MPSRTLPRRPFRPRPRALAMPVALALLALALFAPPARTADAADPDWILARLARPAPMRTGFVELRGSALLKEPLRLEGEYRRPDADTLVREVHTPYVETTTIRAGEVTIARAGRAPRRFSLARSPELTGLQASFGALLAGDRAGIERHYRLAADGTRRQWRLTLRPKDAALAAKLREVVLYGGGAELRCIETQPAQGVPQRTLVAGAAQAAAGVRDPAALAALCRGDGEPG